MSSLIGKRLQEGKYKLESVLGRGGFGLTFRAYQTYLEQVVVIKTLNESFWSAPNLEDLQRQFQDEGRRLAMCQHPNVVRVTDFFVEDYLPYMVMDYIPGRSLYDIVFGNQGEPEPLSEALAVQYIQQIGSALQAVHSKGLLHRDVKPQNIMVHDLTGEAILIDFGIARELTPNPAKTHTSIVSEGYAPIEQYLPKAHRSAATDVYGLAATLYLLLTGEVPVAAVLRDRTPMVPIQQLRPDVSLSMANAIAQGMQIELKDRPQSVGKWLSLLTAAPLADRSTGRIPDRTIEQPTEQTRQQTQAQSTENLGIEPSAPLPLPSPSQLPTKVVAPAYPNAVQSGHQADAGVVPARTTDETVAMTSPTGLANQADYGATQRKGNGCGLLLFSLVLAGLAAAGGFLVVQQLFGRDTAAPLPDLTEIETAEPTLEEPAAVIPEEDEADLEEEQPETEETDSEDEGTEPIAENPTIVEQPTEPTDSGNRTPPLLLEDSGNPANAQPGTFDQGVIIPGLPPGSSEARIQSRLGAPSRAATVSGFPTRVYNRIPNRVRLAYVFDPASNRVRQSEATFSPAVDRLSIRTTLLNMLDGQSTVEIERGLEAVINGARDHYDFSTQKLSGTITRNRYNHIHIYVRD